MNLKGTGYHFYECLPLCNLLIEMHPWGTDVDFQIQQLKNSVKIIQIVPSPSSKVETNGRAIQVLTTPVQNNPRSTNNAMSLRVQILNKVTSIQHPFTNMNSSWTNAKMNAYPNEWHSKKGAKFTGKKLSMTIGGSTFNHLRGDAVQKKNSLEVRRKKKKSFKGPLKKKLLGQFNPKKFPPFSP